MKKVLLLISLIFSLSVAFSQTTFPITQTLGSPQTLVVSKGGFRADSSLIIPSFTDTLAANKSSYIKKYPGNLIWAQGQVWVRNSDATAWVILATSPAIPGTVTAVSSGYGISNTPPTIVTSGTVTVDTSVSGLSGKYVRIIDTSAMLSKYLRKIDTASLSNRINLKVNISDTAAMLSKYLRKSDTTAMLLPYLRKIDTTAMLSKYLRKSDTTAILNPYLRKIDTASLSNRIDSKQNTLGTTLPLRKQLDVLSITQASYFSNGYIDSFQYRDFLEKIDTVYRIPGKDSIYISANGLVYKIKDSVGGGSISISQGYGILNSPNPITSTGTITIDSSTLSSKYLRINDTTAMLSKYLRKTDTTAMLSPYLRKIDTTAMLFPYLRKIDTTNRFVNRIERTPGKDSIIFYVGATRYAIKDSTGGSGTVTRAVDTIYRTLGKDSIIFTINNNRYAIKDSVGSGGGGTPAGSNGYVQFNSSGSFGADSKLFWDNDLKGLGVGTDVPQTKLDVVFGAPSNVPFNYEMGVFTKDGDAKLGVYNVDNYSSGTGSSIALGNVKNYNANERYPGFEFQNVNDSANYGNSFVRYNYFEKDAFGDIITANVNLFNIYANGTVEMSPSSFGLSVSPRLIIGGDNSGEAMLETSGDAYIQGKLTSKGARIKNITFVDDGSSTTYTATSTDHIIIFATYDNNSTVVLPASPEDGRELIIKHAGAIGDYTLTIDGGSHNIDELSSNTGTILNDSIPNAITIVYYNGSWYTLTGQYQ